MHKVQFHTDFNQTTLFWDSCSRYERKVKAIYEAEKKNKQTPVWSVVEKHLKDSNDYSIIYIILTEKS